jgi:hypothetical protein
MQRMPMGTGDRGWLTVLRGAGACKGGGGFDASRVLSAAVAGWSIALMISWGSVRSDRSPQATDWRVAGEFTVGWAGKASDRAVTLVVRLSMCGWFRGAVERDGGKGLIGLAVEARDPALVR